MKSTRARSSSAFTLLELMVSMMLVGVVVAAIYSTWRAIARGSQAGQAAAANAQRTRVALNALETALYSVRSFQVDIKYYGFVAESGSDASLSFVSWLPGSFLRHGKFQDFQVRRVTFSLEDGEGSGRNLVLRQTPILMEMDETEKEDPLILARNVKDFIVEFADNRSGDWLDEWTQTNQLPKKVRITLRIGANDSFSSEVAQEVTRIVVLPSVTVQSAWQIPQGPGGGGPGSGPSPGRPPGGQPNPSGSPQPPGQ